MSKITDFVKKMSEPVHLRGRAGRRGPDYKNVPSIKNYPDRLPGLPMFESNRRVRLSLERVMDDLDWLSKVHKDMPTREKYLTERTIWSLKILVKYLKHSC